MEDTATKCRICGKGVLVGRLRDHLRVAHEGAEKSLFQAWQCALGHSNGAGARFCTTCGRPDDSSEGATPVLCAGGHPLASDEKFCPKCGAGPKGEGRVSSSNRVGSPFPWQYVLYGAVGFLLLLVVVILAQRGDHLATGEEVAAHTEDRVTSNYTRPVDQVECPDQDLDDGDSIVCQIAFRDGQFASIKVTVSGSPGDVRFYEELAP